MIAVPNAVGWLTDVLDGLLLLVEFEQLEISLACRAENRRIVEPLNVGQMLRHFRVTDHGISTDIADLQIHEGKEILLRLRIVRSNRSESILLRRTERATTELEQFEVVCGAYIQERKQTESALLSVN